MNTSIERGLPYSEYAKRPGVNAYLLKIVYRFSLQHAKAYLDGSWSEESDALDFGTAFHSLALENKREYVVRPETYPAGPKHEKVKSGEIKEGDPLPWNSNSAWCKQWAKELNGKDYFTAEESDRLEGMAAAVRAELGDLLDDGDAELSVFTEKDGVPVKARIDLLTKDTNGPVIDLKSTKRGEPRSFTSHAWSLGYMLQVAWNIDVLRWAGIDRKEFWLVAVESEKPYAVSVVKFQDESMSFMRAGRRYARAAFAKLKDAHATNRWPGYGVSYAEEHATPWMLQELELTS